jgi:tetratricopeptide (TPR) repeat protein
MLQATDPRKPEVINIAAARIGEFSKPPKGSRNAARNLNVKGLSEFKKGNVDEASLLLQQAATLDPSDVEIQSNLGLALLRANRLAGAQVALRAALALNPRRTGAWVPMAEYFFEEGDSAKATSSLLLAYEFSENREKTRKYFEGKAGATDRNSTIYALALKKLDGAPRSSEETGDANLPKIKQGALLTLNDARAKLLEKVSSDPGMRNDPSMKETYLCTLNDSLEAAFGGATVLDEATFERRMTAAVTRMAAELKDKESETTLKMLRCFITANAHAQAVARKKAPDLPSSVTRPTPSVPPLDMDDLPPLVSRVYAKAWFVDLFRKSMADDVRPEFRDEVIQKELISCIVPNINAAINKIFPGRVNELDRATFEDRLDITLFKDVFSDEVTKACVTAVKQQVEQKKQSSGRSSLLPVTQMDLDDLRLDLASLTDRKVRVRAVGSYMMNSFILKKSMTDMSPIIVDISNLQREERRQIIQQCSDIMSGCRVTVSGTVRKGSLQNKLSAESIELQ